MDFTGSALSEEYWSMADNVHYVRIERTHLEAHWWDVLRRQHEAGDQFPARERGGAVRIQPHGAHLVGVAPALRRIVNTVVKDWIGPVHNATERVCCFSRLRREGRPRQGLHRAETRDRAVIHRVTAPLVELITA
jgi:hypothetical protein